MDEIYSKCKNCGRMKLMGFRCNSCFYTDPDEPHHSTCMCIECVPTPKEVDPHATDTEQAVTAQADLTEWDDLGGEVG